MFIYCWYKSLTPYTLLFSHLDGKSSASANTLHGLYLLCLCFVAYHIEYFWDEFYISDLYLYYVHIFVCSRFVENQ
jgi:hypothetical protein